MGAKREGPFYLPFDPIVLQPPKLNTHTQKLFFSKINLLKWKFQVGKKKSKPNHLTLTHRKNKKYSQEKNLK
jgi:hypothetical protein